jgi:hypothetical protein
MGLMLLGAATMLSITIAGGVRSTITNGIVAFGFWRRGVHRGLIEQILACSALTARHVGTVVSLLSPSDSMWRRAAYELQPLATAVLRNGRLRRLRAERRHGRVGGAVRLSCLARGLAAAVDRPSLTAQRQNEACAGGRPDTGFE